MRFVNHACVYCMQKFKDKQNFNVMSTASFVRPHISSPNFLSGFLCDLVCLSAWNNAASTGRIFIKFDDCVRFKNVGKIQVSLKSDKNNG